MVPLTRVISLLLALLLLALPAFAQETTWSTNVAALEECGARLAKCKAFLEVSKLVAEDATRLDELSKGTVAAQRAALRIMASQGARTEALRLLLESVDKLVRLEAVGLAANTRQNELAPSIMVMALKAREEEDEQVLLKAILALGRLSHPDATPLLMELIHDPVQKIARAAIEALGRVGGNEEIVAAVGKQARDEGQPSNRRLVAIRGLGYFKDDSAVDILVEFSRSDDVTFRRAAVEALGRTKNRRAVPQLVERLKDEEVLPQLVAALASIGGEKAAAMLYNLSADESRTKEVRFDALCAAGRAGSKRSAAGLIKALSSRQGDERTRAAEALGHMAHEDAMEPLAKRFKKAKGREKTMMLWAIKRTSGEALDTEEQIDEYLKKKEK
jgi:HEAT repeat protein